MMASKATGVMMTASTTRGARDQYNATSAIASKTGRVDGGEQNGNKSHAALSTMAMRNAAMRKLVVSRMATRVATRCC